MSKDRIFREFYTFRKSKSALYDYLYDMKKKLLLFLSVIAFAAIGFFILKALFIGKDRLRIPNEGLTLNLEEQSFELIESTGDPIRISLGKVSRKEAYVQVLLGNNKLKQSSLELGNSMDFNYEKKKYTLSLKDIDVKLLGQEKAEFLLQEKGKAEKQMASKDFLNVLEQSDIEIWDNKGKPFTKKKMLKRLGKISRSAHEAEDLIEFAKVGFHGFTVKENNDTKDFIEWLNQKK